MKAPTTKRSFYFVLLLNAAILSSCGPGRHAANEDPEVNAPSKGVQKKYAELLQVESSKIDNLPLYSFIDEWYGVPYKYGGKTKTGIDCSNFTCTLYHQVYKRTLSGSSSSLFEQCRTVSKNDLREGDLVFFKIEGDKISHIGIYLQNNKFVHATTRKGVMIDDLDEAYYKKYYYRGGRLK